MLIQERRQDVLNKKIAMCELELEKSVKERVQVKYLMQQQKVNLKRKTVPKADVNPVREVNPVYSYQNIQPQAESNTLRKATSQQHLKDTLRKVTS